MELRLLCPPRTPNQTLGICRIRSKQKGGPHCADYGSARSGEKREGQIPEKIVDFNLYRREGKLIYGNNCDIP